MLGVEEPRNQPGQKSLRADLAKRWTDIRPN